MRFFFFFDQNDKTKGEIRKKKLFFSVKQIFYIIRPINRKKLIAQSTANNIIISVTEMVWNAMRFLSKSS